MIQSLTDANKKNEEDLWKGEACGDLVIEEELNYKEIKLLIPGSLGKSIVFLPWRSLAYWSDKVPLLT